MTVLWISHPRMTGQVDVDGDTIVEVPPIWHGFRGKRLGALLGWLRKTCKPADLLVERLN
jgi:hypothetical protein